MKWVVVGQNILWAGPARFKKTATLAMTSSIAAK
jgi:hypothetical protein